MVMCLCIITSDKGPVRFGLQQVVTDHECSRPLQMRRRWGCLNGLVHLFRLTRRVNLVFILPCLREVYSYKAFMVI